MAITNADLDQLAGEVTSELGVPGAQVAVLHRGGLSEGVAGVASLDTRVPVTPETLFSVGSTTKVLTAALVMQLVEERSIELDGPVVEQLPGFVLSDAEATRAVTPRHLMSMTSGIDNGPYTDYGLGDDALRRYVDALAEVPHIYPPGEGFGYTNASTNVSGRLVEHVLHRSWEEALATKLLEPAGLENSALRAADLIPRRIALGHTLDEARAPQLVREWPLLRSMGPSGGTLCSTASDLVRLAHLFLHSGRSVEGTQVLTPWVVSAMQTREATAPPTLVADWWGLGPYGKSWDGVDVIGHSGTTLVGSSHLLWTIDHDIAIATTVNVAKLGYPFAARVFEILFKDLAGITAPRKRMDSEVPDADHGRLVGRYAMSGLTLTISEDGEALTAAASSDTGDFEEAAPSRLVPITPTTFLPTDPAIDGHRGWALAFIGPEDRPATHLLNGLWALRREE